MYSYSKSNPLRIMDLERVGSIGIGLCDYDDYVLTFKATTKRDYISCVYPYMLRRSKLYGLMGDGLYSVGFWKGDNYMGLLF